MRKLCFLIAVGCAFGCGAFAQEELSQMDIFVGYSLLRVNMANQVPTFNANGGVGTLAWNINNHIGIEAEFAAHYSGNVNDYHLDSTTFTYLFGPRLSYGRTKRFDPYVHALFGGGNDRISVAANSALIPAPVPVPSSGRYKATQNGFAMAIGGGIDIKISKHVLLRPAQLDYVYTRFETPAFLGPSSANQNNFRFAVGVAFNVEDELP